MEFPLLRNGLAIQNPLSEGAPLFRTLLEVCPMSMGELGNLSKGEMLILSHTYPDLHFKESDVIYYQAFLYERPTFSALVSQFHLSTENRE